MALIEEKTIQRQNLSTLLGVVLPVIRSLIKVGYFSFDVKGLKHVPRTGPVIYVANHAGWATLDSFFFALAICDGIGPHRMPYTAINDIIVELPIIGPFFKDLGVIPTSLFHDFKNLPPEINIFGIYPEGLSGNCKPFWKAYQMEKWRIGFVRLAIEQKAKVVPMAFIGGEECLPAAGKIEFLKSILGTVVPLPLFGVPLPCSWKIIFHKPIDFSPYSKGKAQDRAFCIKTAEKIQKMVQKTLDRETSRRPLVRLSKVIKKFL